jgi:hypothetical protein
MAGACLLSTPADHKLQPQKSGKFDLFADVVREQVKIKQRSADAAAAADKKGIVICRSFRLHTAFACSVEQRLVRHAKQSELHHARRGYLVLSGLRHIEHFSDVFDCGSIKEKERSG